VKGRQRRANGQRLIANGYWPKCHAVTLSQGVYRAVTLCYTSRSEKSRGGDRPTNPYTFVGRSLLDREYKEIKEIKEIKEKSLNSLNSLTSLNSLFCVAKANCQWPIANSQ